MKALISETVKETMLTLGVRTDDPLEVQKDFAWLRETRTTVGSVRVKTLLAGAGLAVTALGALTWAGVKSILGK